MPLVELYFPCFQCHCPRFSLIFAKFHVAIAQVCTEDVLLYGMAFPDDFAPAVGSILSASYPSAPLSASWQRVFGICRQFFCQSPKPSSCGRLQKWPKRKNEVKKRDPSDLVQEWIGWKYFCIIGTIATSVVLPK